MATAIENHQQDYYTQTREAARQVWEGLNQLLALQAEWNAGTYGDDLGAGTGDNDGLTKDDLGPVIFDGANALETALNAGHATAFVKLL